MGAVAKSLREQIGKRDPFDAVEQEAYFNIRRTSALMGTGFAKLFRAHGLTEASYNVLRILRGAGAEGRASGDIAKELVTPGPDVTRLVDRLVVKGLAGRRGRPGDGRVVMVSLTPAGWALLAELDRPVMDLHRAQFQGMQQGDIGRLSRLLEEARDACEANSDGASS